MNTTPTAPQDALMPVTHEQARESLDKFIRHFFHMGGAKPTAHIPAQPATDDDLVLSRYIEQQAAANPPVTQAASAEGESVGMEDDVREAIRRAELAAVNGNASAASKAIIKLAALLRTAGDGSK